MGGAEERGMDGEREKEEGEEGEEREERSEGRKGRAFCIRMWKEVRKSKKTRHIEN